MFILTRVGLFFLFYKMFLLEDALEISISELDYFFVVIKSERKLQIHRLFEGKNFGFHLQVQSFPGIQICLQESAFSPILILLFSTVVSPSRRQRILYSQMILVSPNLCFINFLIPIGNKVSLSLNCTKYFAVEFYWVACLPLNHEEETGV